MIEFLAEVLINRNKHKILQLVFLYFVIIQPTAAQTLNITGRITASRFPIKNASITFIDKADTLNKFTALTNATGHYQLSVPTSVGNHKENIPASFELEQSYPNPFSSTTAIPYQLKKVTDVQVIIYDILGKTVKKFNVGMQGVGRYNVLWDGRNNFGQKVAKGIYFYRLLAGGESQVKKMIFNESGSTIVSFPQINASITSNINHLKKQSIAGGNYKILIENTSTTIPMIEQSEYDNVQIHNDTTLSFTLTYIPTTEINFDDLHQIIRGFGAASPWYLPVMTDTEVESAFGMDDEQIGLSIFRITVEADSNLWSKWIPSTKKAQDMGAIIIASPWYAPSSMTETINGKIRIRLDKYGEYVNHLNSFLKFMEKNGVSIYGLSVQNEPEMDDWTNWSQNEMFTFMKDYAGAIEGTNVMAPEVSNFGRSYSDLILNDSIACANTDIICGHIYGGGLARYPLAADKGKEVWMTEYLFGENNSGNNLSWAIKLAKNINDVMKADMNAYVWWTMVRYYGPIGDGTKASNPQDPEESYPKKGEVTKKGYVLSQFSRFIRPGFYRVNSEVFPPVGNVDVTAYKDPSSSKIVIVAVNSGSTPAENYFRLQSGTAGRTFTPYISSAEKNCEQGEVFYITGDSFSYILEALSITTFISN